ncbi:uncharacterized protein LOC103309369 [Acyrthosiphon pisum]|uniref:DUF4371 domain-containing protein n=1 Tax=Acyrthosiphon pisum TaxID=7029 RepID=A0A8R2B5H8_ACYPI|nr:uncharacterized protein LOC103309369 [Acyrthosiphon pisum]|eukprot:XP_008182864.1 PREDICTED: uncharacterized protein LOC103309369 [Acyrthosiphon pisum]
MSDFEDDPLNIGGPPRKIQKIQHRAQKFRREWCSSADFKDWLIPDENDVFKAKCSLCKSSMIAELSNIKNHGKGIKHKQIVTAGTVKQTSISTFVHTDKNLKLKSQIQRAEIKIAAFISEHNVAFLAADHLPGLLKDCFPDSEIAKGISTKRTKTTAIIKNVIGNSAKEELTESLKNNKFSILTDESTDIGTVKTSCVVVRLFDKSIGKIVSKFWDLHPVFNSLNPGSATAEKLFNLLMESFLTSIFLKKI